MKHNSGVRWYSTISQRNLWKKSLNLNFENVSNYLEKSAKVKFINSSVVQNSAKKESYMACEVNAEVSRSHSNEASSSSTTRTIGCFQTFRAIGPNILKCQYQMSSNILKCHILQWSILLWPICLCHNRVCIILICKEVKGTITIHLDIIVITVIWYIA